MQVKSLTPLFSREQIEERVKALADKLNRDYAGRRVVMICVLKGAFMFFADLLKHVTFGPEIDFVRLASYGSADSSSGSVSMTGDAELSFEGKDVVLVEDIVDTGASMDFLVRHYRDRGAKSLRIAALVDKFERREVPVPVEYAGFSLSSGFIVGYGLDYAERFRELPAIYTVELEP